MDAKKPGLSKQDVLNRAAASMGLDPGGRGTGHLETVWAAAYQAGRQDAIAEITGLLRSMPYRPG